MLSSKQEYALAEILRRAQRMKQLSALLDDMQRTVGISLHTPSSGTITVGYEGDMTQYLALNQVFKDLLKADKKALEGLVKEGEE